MARNGQARKAYNFNSIDMSTSTEANHVHTCGPISYLGIQDLILVQHLIFSLRCELPVLSAVPQGAYMPPMQGGRCPAIAAQHKAHGVHTSSSALRQDGHRPCPTFPRLLTPFVRASPVGRV